MTLRSDLRVATRRSSVLSVALAVAMTVGLTACGEAENADHAEMTQGHALYEANCGTCHGEEGLGDGQLAASLPIQPPSLLEHLGHHPQDQLIRIIRTGVPPAMPPAPLTEDEVRLVIEHAWTLVPDSLLDGLREMQRMAEMGMDMGMGMGPDSSGSMSSMAHDSSEAAMPMDTARHH